MAAISISRLGLLPGREKEFENYLRTQNPFTQIRSGIGGPDTQLARDNASLFNAVNWQNQQIAGAANPQPVAFNPSTFQHGTAWNSFLPPSTQSGQTGATPGNNPFETVSNVKNPAIQAAINASLGQVNGLSTDPNQNSFITRTNVKSPEQQTRINAAGGQFDADVTNNRQSLADFSSAFLNNTPQTTAATNQEVGAIGEFYGGANSVQSNLDRVATAKNAAVTAAAQRAGGAAQRGANVGRMLTGDSSYIDYQLADSLAGIGAQQAMQDADLRRTNYLAVKDAQTQLAGRRQGLLDANANRLLQPIQATTALGNTELGQAAQLGGLDNANNIYSLDSADQMLQRRLGLLGMVGEQDRANTFYGLRGGYGADTRGYLPMPDYGGGGGFPNYSGGGSGGYGMSGAPPRAAAPDRRSPAASRYHALTGMWPDSDPSYSPEAMQWVLGHNDDQRATDYFQNAGVSPYLDNSFSQELWDY